jgi:hypothetical protein
MGLRESLESLKQYLKGSDHAARSSVVLSSIMKHIEHAYKDYHERCLGGKPESSVSTEMVFCEPGIGMAAAIATTVGVLCSP